MNIQQVFVQSEEGVPFDETFHKAWHGFQKRRVRCQLVEASEIENGSLPLNKETLVVGGIRSVEKAMAQIGMTMPVANNLPEELRAYFGRKITRTTLGEVRQQWRAGDSESCFLKPLNQNKKFPAIALFHVDDLETLEAFPNDTAVLVSDYVLFDSEWRVFVVKGEVLGMSHYQSDCFTYPDKATIQSAIADFTNAPAGYGIDFGVLSNGKTVIVEANDGYSLGSYSLNSVDYTRLLEARWAELAGLAA